MTRTIKPAHLLLLVLLLNMCLTIYGIWWGLPDRWNVDEHVAKSLRFIASGSIFTVVDTAHPQAYDILLGIWMIPYLAVMKIIGYPLSAIKTAASVSWISLALNFPVFATLAYIWGRLSSVILNLLSIAFIYKIGLLIYKKSGAALIASLIAALSMGFIEIGHFTKATSLAASLVLAAAYYSFKAIENDSKKDLYIASIFTGAALSVQADGAFSAIYLAVASFIYLKRKDISWATIKTFIISAILVITVFFILWPVLLAGKHAYTAKEMAGFSMKALPEPGAILSKIKDNIKFTLYIFSPALAIFVWLGIGYNIRKWREYLIYNNTFALVLVPYISMAILYFAHFPGAYTKFLIHAVPILSLWAGLFIYDFLKKTSPARNIKLAVMIIVFFTAALYAMKGSSVFAEYDTRYYSGDWISKNIPKGSTIEHFQDVDLLFPATRLIKDYNIIFYGRNSKDYAGKKFYDAIDDKEKASYMKHIDRNNSKADYIIAASGKDFLLPSRLESEENRNSIIYRLMKGKQKGYRLIKYIAHSGSILTDPRPAYTSPDIWIFKKTER